MEIINIIHHFIRYNFMGDFIMRKFLLVSVTALITTFSLIFIGSSEEPIETDTSKENNVLSILVTNQTNPVAVWGEVPDFITKPAETKVYDTDESHAIPKDAKVTVVNGYRFYRTKSIDALRNADYGTSDKTPIHIWSHSGGKRLDTKRLITTIDAVLQRMPNVKSSKKFTALILETFLVETDLGLADFEKAANRQRNYGIAQFTMGTAKDILQYLKKTRKDVYDVVMSMYNDKLSLRDNLVHNTPFSIALCAQLYLRCIPDIHPNIHTVRQRATAWKVYYNSIYGQGTIENYVTKVNYFRGKKII